MFYPTLFNSFNSKKDLWSPFSFNIGRINDPLTTLRANISGNKYILTMDMPGIKKENLEILIEDEGIRLSWEDRLGSKNEHFFDIPEEFNDELSSAELKDGILQIFLELKPKPKRKIEIK